MDTSISKSHSLSVTRKVIMFKKIFTLFFSAVYWSIFGLSSIPLFAAALVIWIVTLPIDRRRVVLHRFTCLWAALYMDMNPYWHVTISGKENIDRKKAYIILSNHQSMMDVALMDKLYIHFKWVSKAEVFKAPFIGWTMWLNKYISVIRGSMKSKEKMLADCTEALNTGSSVVIFPEGTRSVDGHIRDFKRGAFDLALSAKKDILPVVLDGTMRILPKKSLILNGSHRIKLKVLKPIPYESFAGNTPEQIMIQVRGLMMEELEKLRSK